MKQYERIDISEGINLDNTNASREYMLCRYWYFKNVCYKFELNVCNKCHNILMTVYTLKNFGIVNIKDVDYKCILWRICKNVFL